MFKLSHLELFSGVGGFREAFDLFGLDNGFDSVCVGFSEIDKYAKQTYEANFSLEGVVDLGDILNFSSSDESILSLPNFTMLTAGFPCQPFSMMGLQQGFDDCRGNTFFAILKILQKKRPPYVLLENVRNLRNHDKGRTIETILQSLQALGYAVYYDIFDTNDFQLAQRRNRIFIFASLDELPKSFVFSSQRIQESFNHYLLNNSPSLLVQKDVLEVLQRDGVDERFYLSDRIKPTILSHGSGNYYSKSKINQLIARPLTATMVKLHRANQDNYYSDEFLQSDNPYEVARRPQISEELLQKRIRRITPEEAFLLQGFSSQFYQNASIAGVSDFQLLKQSGNAVSVNTVYAILYYLFVEYDLLIGRET